MNHDDAHRGSETYCADEVAASLGAVRVVQRVLEGVADLRGELGDLTRREREHKPRRNRVDDVVAPRGRPTCGIGGRRPRGIKLDRCAQLVVGCEEGVQADEHLRR